MRMWAMFSVMSDVRGPSRGGGGESKRGNGGGEGTLIWDSRRKGDTENMPYWECVCSTTWEIEIEW